MHAQIVRTELEVAQVVIHPARHPGRLRRLHLGLPPDVRHRWCGARHACDAVREKVFALGRARYDPDQPRWDTAGLLLADGKVVTDGGEALVIEDER